MMRSIATVVCLLYLSVSTVFAAIHHHDGSRNDQQCTACSWHHDAAVDEPVVAPLIIRPEIIVVQDESPSFTLRKLSLRIHPSRGPPVLL
jgi:hypothetical protein